MCYPKPGPRCSAHAKIALEKAHAAYHRAPSDETYKKFAQAKDVFLSTPAGIKILEGEYAETKSVLLEFEIADRKALRSKQLRQVGATVDEDGQKVFHPEESIQQAMNSTLSWGSSRPVWWHEYSRESTESKTAAASPEILDVIDSPEGKLAVVWEDTSQARNDSFTQLESGYQVQRCVLRSWETGKEVGEVKVSWVSDETIKRSFGDDEFTPFRYQHRYSGTHYGFGEDELYDKNPLHEDALLQRRREVWRIANTHDRLRYRSPVAGRTEPSDEQVKTDLEEWSREIRSDMTRWKESLATPFVDYSSISKPLRGQGFGTALYIYTARKLGTQGKVLRSSGLQSDKAKEVWARFQKRFPQHIRSTSHTSEFGEKQETFILSFPK